MGDTEATWWQKLGWYLGLGLPEDESGPRLPTRIMMPVLVVWFASLASVGVWLFGTLGFFVGMAVAGLLWDKLIEPALTRRFGDPGAG